MRGALLAVAATLVASGCTRPAGQLPEEPVERAATCTAVRALELSAGKTEAGAVSFEGFT